MLEFIKEYWSIPIVLFIFITGLILTVRLKGIQFRESGKSLKLLLKKGDGGSGEVSSFGALCVSLSATLGTGNIIGVATAIHLGGPGSLFWMLFVSLFGLATKYSEGFLAIKYRKFKDDGTVIGGPCAYIKYGMGEKFTYLAKLFAIFAALAALLAVGTMTQSNGITESFNDVIASKSLFTLFGKDVTIVSVVVGALVTILAGFAIIGGIKRISKICELIIPVMFVLYICCIFIIIGRNIVDLPSTLWLILKSAFTFKAMAVGTVTYTFLKALTSGVMKGIFSNEAGLGSTPIALASSQTDSAKQEGLISMGAMVITVVLCLLTGIAVIITNAYNIGLEGVHITNYAFTSSLFFGEQVGSIILLMCIFFFAITTIIGWSVYGIKSIEFLFDKKVFVNIYIALYLVMILLGAFLKIEFIWNVADVINAFMAVPNLISLICLSKVIRKESLTKDAVEA